MLNSVFGITKNPFGKKVDPKDAFCSAAWKPAVKKLELLIKYRGIGVVAADSGMGKSTLVRIVTSELNPKAYRIIYICDVLLSDTDFLKIMAFDLGIEPPHQKSKLIRAIRQTLTGLNDTQRIHTIIILDEVHLVKNSLLEQLRILTNFCMDSQDLFTTILIGQNSFLTKLSLNISQALKQRISYLIKLSALSSEDTRQYISHRLKTAGVHHQIFGDNAINAIYQASSGIPREINNIALAALGLAAEAGQNTISDDIMARAIEETELIP
jgi:type II secretory pathway predicted ATPase ExeA